MPSSNERSHAEQAAPADPAASVADSTTLGEDLIARQRQISWSLSDWVLAGTARYGERIFSDAVRLTKPEIDRLAPIVETCRRSPRDRRRLVLRLAHHQAVLKLNDTAAHAMLDRAEREGLTPAAVKAAVRITTSPGAEPVIDDDPTDTGFRRIAQAWNREGKAARRLILEQMEESGVSVIDL